MGSGPVLGGDMDGDGAPEPTFPRGAFRVRELRSNLVLRWQYQPGSSVFLVWSQDRSGLELDGGLSLGRDVRDLFGTHPRNVLLLKVEHFFPW